jgi:hypothetical protein
MTAAERGSYLDGAGAPAHAECRTKPNFNFFTPYPLPVLALTFTHKSACWTQRVDEHGEGR